LTSILELKIYQHCIPSISHLHHLQFYVNIQRNKPKTTRYESSNRELRGKGNESKNMREESKELNPTLRGTGIRVFCVMSIGYYANCFAVSSNTFAVVL